MIHIVADENIPCLEKYCQSWARLTLLPGQSITRDALCSADALFVRSVTKVNADLLRGTPVKFVGTATIGTDHVNLPDLSELNICFASAPGSNAQSVAEYVVSALLALSEQFDRPLEGLSIGIIGVGNVGKRVAKLCSALEMKVFLNDPPRARTEGVHIFQDLDKVLNSADIITLHTPLVHDGPYPTNDLVDSSFLSRVKKGAWLLNTSRGPVCNEQALQTAIQGNQLQATVLDVWPNEPNISPNLLRKVTLGTPHIAGYSYEGKIRGAQMIVEAAKKNFGLQPNAHLDEFCDRRRWIDPCALKSANAVTSVVQKAYNVRCDSRRLKALLDLPDLQMACEFLNLRKNYPKRHEFATYLLPPQWDGQTPFILPKLLDLGFGQE